MKIVIEKKNGSNMFLRKIKNDLFFTSSIEDAGDFTKETYNKVLSDFKKGLLSRNISYIGKMS